MIPAFPKVDFAPSKANTSELAAEFAGIIFEQINTLDSLAFDCLDCHEFEPIENGLRLKNAVVFQTVVEDMVNDPDMLNSLVQARGNIDITHNGSDYYDMVGYTVDEAGNPGFITFTSKDVMAFDMWEILRNIWE